MPERPIPVASLTNTWVYSCSLAGTVGSNPTGGMHVSCECCVFSGIGLCIGLLTHPEFYQVWCVLRWGLHEATLHATYMQVQLPASKQVGSKLSMPIRCWNEKAG